LSEKESIVEWIFRVRVLRFIFYKLLAPIWNFVMERFEDTVIWIAWARDKLGF
jgi:hypothetical protein